MKYEDLVLYMIELYIENEIDYIQQEIAIQETKKDYDLTSEKNDLKYLEDLTLEDKLEIINNIFDNTDFIDYTSDIIQEYLYKYQNEKRGKNE